MKTLYLECNMGAAGDMLTAALLELVGDEEESLARLNAIGLPNIRYQRESVEKCGIRGTCVNVLVDGGHDHEGHSHQGMGGVENAIRELNASEEVKKNAMDVYRLIAEAESHVHGKPVTQIHFHEVGDKDAIADVVGACLLMEELGVKKIIASPVHVGSGTVRCAHGVLPVPAPATAYLLKGVPIYQSEVEGELCTPTGAAILKHFAKRFLPMPTMDVEKIGYGMGKKDFARANCVRAFLGETAPEENESDVEVVELSCNLDDMTGEAVGYAIGVLLAHGALDVFTVPVQMKKNRPGILLTCICAKDKADIMAKLILRHTTTFGVRHQVCKRYVLNRKFAKVRTDYGEVTIKTGEGYGVVKTKPEYEEVATIAKTEGLSIYEVMNALRHQNNL